ncbi:hypothetical protein RIF29_17734 [Crotalaria pallida]|uniref:Leucine-rich repeat-containing N-terminal plant-type domain-containing protein n=1 Tax=Crotalaria pallida TaxID=3830 RepID=A0AAN9FJW8_CROPI
MTTSITNPPLTPNSTIGNGIYRSEKLMLLLSNMESPPNFTSFLFFLSLTLIASSILVSGNSESDALYALKQSLSDPQNVLASWDPSLVTPCQWDLGDSNLSGHLVPELANLQNLQYFEIYNNNIDGVIPLELGNLKSLVSLDLYQNRISGNIPRELGNMKNLLFLRLNDNKLSGILPKEVQSLPNIRVL